mmetsp:Transcript_43001/g.79988  ORF Transcript_43001/g.79988 Transcript_43001/m.79988 type:complete len:354 (-) Transcript_43001:12-1073(-)
MPTMCNKYRPSGKEDDESFTLYEDDIKKEGWLQKQSAVLLQWRRRWCVLTSQFVCSFRYEGNYKRPTEIMKLSEILSVKGAELETGKEHCIAVQSEDRTFFLIAPSALEKEEWSGSIMNWCLPEIACRGVRRSLTLFSIEELEEEDDEDATPSPRRGPSWYHAVMTPMSRKSTGDRTRKTDASPLACPTTPGRRGNPFMLPRTPRTQVTFEDSAEEDAFLQVKGDQVLMSPSALHSMINLRTPKGLCSPLSASGRPLGGRCFPATVPSSYALDDVIDTVSLTSTGESFTFQDAVAEWRKENATTFSVGEEVYARDYEVQTWVAGVVTCADPLKVQPHGKHKGCEFVYVQHTID